MNKIIATTLFVIVSLSVLAQTYPSEWMKYTSDGYFYDIESGHNSQNLSESRFKTELLDLARANLSKQIQVKVEEVSSMDKNVVDGRSSILYTSMRSVSTDVDMQLAETRTQVDPISEKLYVIAYINKGEACNYYKNDVQMRISNLNNTLSIADNYIRAGFKAKAKTEFENALPQFDGAGKSFFWLNVFGMSEYQLNQYLEQVNRLEQTVKAKLAELEHGVTYCVVCNAKNFGKSYPKLQNELKGELSMMGCNFVDDHERADFVIRVEASSREYNQMNTAGGSVYFSYVDAAVAIDKNATGQRIFEDEISVKGSHTLNFEEAGRDGYKKVSKEIRNLLKENINYNRLNNYNNED